MINNVYMTLIGTYIKLQYLGHIDFEGFFFVPCVLSGYLLFLEGFSIGNKTQIILYNLLSMSCFNITNVIY